MTGRRTLGSPQVYFWILLLALTLWTRFFDLTNKPLHFDEGINGWFVMNMQQLGYYKYDPNNYHGPLYFYILQFFESFLGRFISTLRSVPAFFSLLGVGVLAFPSFAGRGVRGTIASLFLLSPAFLFFGRSGIHEVPFVFFQIVFAIGLLRWLEKKDEVALGLCGFGLCGMLLLKETFVLTLASFACAFAVLGWTRIKIIFSLKELMPLLARTRHLFLLLFLAFFLFYSGFLKNLVGIFDFVKAFLPWFKTGTQGNGHEKEFQYWIQVLLQAEPVAFVGVLLAFWGVFSKNLQFKVMSVFSLTQLLLYSLIPYKTIWCIVSLIWGFYFVLSFALSELWMRNKKMAQALGLLLLLVLTAQMKSAYTSVFQRPVDMDHPYVYVNSTYQFKELAELIVSELKKNPDWATQTIQVGITEQWPWPWLLSEHKNLDYSLCKTKLSPSALVYLCDLADAPLAEPQFQEAYLKVLVSMRQSREASWVYLKSSAFKGKYQGSFKEIESQKDRPNE